MRIRREHKVQEQISNQLYHQSSLKLYFQLLQLLEISNKVDKVRISMHKMPIKELIMESRYFHQKQLTADNLHMVVVVQMWQHIQDNSKLNRIKLAVEVSLTKSLALLSAVLLTYRLLKLIRTKLVMLSILLMSSSSRVQLQISIRTQKVWSLFRHSITPDKQPPEPLQTLSTNSIPHRWGSDRTNNKRTVQYS